jgi:predicted methyltransferase
MNPWSEMLYREEKIYCILGDSYSLAGTIHNGSFDSIIHDPPRHDHAGNLYGLLFYRKLFRLMKHNGALFHYTGEPRSRYRGVNVQKGVSERLVQAGFKDVNYHKKVMGVTARKP